jgi:nicotinate phosphoribosyltransferase
VNGALAASRAAFIGGAAATSNTLAGRMFGIPVRGTMAHSWVMAFSSELEAFRKYAEVYPDSCTLLIDTYDTLTSGLENAVVVGKSLKSGGHRHFGVRLDSGDLEYLSKQVRQRLDAEGLQEAAIAASSRLDKRSSSSCWPRGRRSTPGVGTHLVTAKGDSALTGVYKLAARWVDGHYQPAIKVSNNPEKISDPGIKQVHRFYNGSGSPIADLLSMEGERVEAGRDYRFYHPRYPQVHGRDRRGRQPLLGAVMRGGKIVQGFPDIPACDRRGPTCALDHLSAHLNPRLQSPLSGAEGPRFADRRVRQQTRPCLQFSLHRLLWGKSWWAQRTTGSASLIDLRLGVC